MPFAIGGSGVKILYPFNNKQNDIKFIYYAIQNVNIPEKSGGYARHGSELLKQRFAIPSDITEQQ
ncbi:MAG: hypothetical protein N2201_07420, partial [candidate division WOR-3 bacterium]|nr:hypothetical protein [candidate division WOR-3 bacterium]